MARARSSFAVAVAGAFLAGLLASACGADGRGAASAGAESSDAARRKVAAFSCPAPAPSPAPAPAPAADPGDRRKPLVVTTVAPITSIVANVAGDRAEVHGVVPEGQDSHTYEPKPSVASMMARADVVFVNGLKLEDPTRDLARANVRPGTPVVELGTATLTPDEYLFDFSFPKQAGKPNPHLWTDPPMAACYARLAAEALAKADPAGASVYRANAAAFGARVDDLDRRMKAATATLPEERRKLLTYHDAYAYFAAQYGWTVIGAMQISNFEDPTPKEVAALITQVKREKVPAIFGSEVFPSPVLAQVGREAGVAYVDKLRDDDLPGDPGDAEHSWLGLMKVDFTTMVGALGGDVRPLADFDPADVVHDGAEYPQ